MIFYHIEIDDNDCIVILNSIFFFEGINTQMIPSNKQDIYNNKLWKRLVVLKLQLLIYFSKLILPLLYKGK